MMKFAYPASSSIDALTPQQTALKIARHCPCTACGTCKGLHPSIGVHVVLDDGFRESILGDLGQYGSDDDEDQPSIPPYLDICACGHGVAEHGANESQIGTEEYRRRASYAIRIDENMQDEGKLLDFAYSDPDIESLRARMTLAPVSMIAPSQPANYDQRHKSPHKSSPASGLRDLPPPLKKRRISMSTLSGDDNDDDEEPLATRVTQKTAPAKSPTKPGKGVKFVPAAGRMPVANGKTNVEPGPRIKIEDKLDDAQLDRLATGVPVDSETTAPPVRVEKAAAIELRQGIIQIMPVQNDRQPHSMVLMTGLKTLFQKQLPKMPRDYIARLVYDANSRALAIVKRGYKVVGGILFRPFPHRGFSEIVFFATASVDQVKGYGGMLMDHYKMHIRKAYPDMNHFLTYADNYAVGYFEKQGFSKEITLDRSVWAGYIKDYEGGTIMQCTMLDKVDYLDKANILAQQQDAIMSKIRQMSRSHVVHPGLPQFQEGAPEGVTVDPKDVPGLRETGWTSSMAENLTRLIPKSPDRHFMDRLLKDLQEHNQAWPFLKPVSAEDVPDYHDIVKKPMDFSTMEHKLDNNHYQTVEDFVNDARLVFDNCRLYNLEDSVYHKCANTLEKFVNEQLKERIKRES
ncbi:histone acetyltransferase NGF-1 [Lentinula guzmanii]|uniref:histone acetyltransferase n=1 Tax=Lentinula guzmanii TaxID=2804957 RepID=A0AA38JIG9_9AGAR|nr:histone acetyltransferase NGF-1 [Lentinula guzmanii]